MFRNFIKRFLGILALVGLAVFASASPAVLAEEEGTTDESSANPSVQLQISPVSNRIVIAPTGAHPLIYTMTIHNTGPDTFEYTLYAAPYSVVDESYDADFTQETYRTQLSRWISFKQDEDGERYVPSIKRTIKPDEKQTVTYKIDVPDDVPEGGQYASIFAEPTGTLATSSVSIRAVSRIGMLLYGHTDGSTSDSAEISEFSLTNFLMSGKITTSALVRNKGNTDFAADQTLVIEKFFGSVIYEDTKSYDVFPDTSRRISAEWADTPIFGLFRVKARVYALGQVAEESKLVLIIPVFVIIIALILLTILIIWLIILFKKRRAQKAKLIV